MKLSLGLLSLLILGLSMSCARGGSGVNSFGPHAMNAGIVGGTVSANGLEKQVARLQIDVRDLFSGQVAHFRCSGTFITKHAVLTAAHCVGMDPLQVTIFVGEDEPATAFKTRATKWTIKEDYSSGQGLVDTDLALLWSEEPLPDSKIVTTLATELPSFKEPVEAAGYGLTYYENQVGPHPFLDDKVRSVKFPHVKDEHSKTWFSLKIDTRSGVSGGDSGGPLFTGEGESRKQIAVAGSIQNTMTGGDAIYVVVASHLDWIRQTAADLEKNH